jgi:Fe(3+) dicitrate transport protein
MRHIILIFFVFPSLIAYSQESDSLKTVQLQELRLYGKPLQNKIERLPEVDGVKINSGKKSEVIKVESLDADLSVNNARQIFGKVPGVSIWENDGSGIQMGVATRGLSPNRSWEFNVRQNGYDISSEVFGYPEAYFSPPTEALDRIEIVRGAASLQNGPQFGGLLNYVVKDRISDKPFSFETQQTAGSYGLFNSYNAIGGKLDKLSYYGYFHHRSADGWRDNSEYRTNTGYASLVYNFTEKVKLGFQYTRSYYRSQQPGGLTDAAFQSNPQQSLRDRNWFSAPWNVMALTLDAEISDATTLSAKVFATLGERNSVGFVRPINVADTFNITINSYNPRQVDRDRYENIGAEIRVLHRYKLWNQENALSAGIRAYRGAIDRSQLGTGTTGFDFDLTIASQQNGRDWGRDFDFSTNNYALFVENLFRIGKRIHIIPGLRYEHILQKANGYFNTSATGLLPEQRSDRSFLLGGVGVEYHVSKATEIYANGSQAFRPVTFSELTPSSTTEVVDPDLKDASGYNLDLGYRGKIKDFLQFDISGFYLRYKNRIGTVTQNSNPFRTNIGTSVSKGLEVFAELEPLKIITDKSSFGNISLYASYALVDATYTKWNNPAIANDLATSIEGKRVENAPRHITRAGLTYSLKKFSTTIQLNDVSNVYTDAANTEVPNATGTVGKIAGYRLIDASFTLLVGDYYNVKAGVNNLTDEAYATRRAGGYPGPGLLPGNGRTWFVSIGARF